MEISRRYCSLERQTQTFGNYIKDECIEKSTELKTCDLIMYFTVLYHYNLWKTNKKFDKEKTEKIILLYMNI